MKFSEYNSINEGKEPKYKVGDEPKFKDKSQQRIATLIRSFVSKDKGNLHSIHYPAGGKLVKSYTDGTQMVLKVTDKACIDDMYDFLLSYRDVVITRDSYVLKVLTTDKKSASFKIQLSSGRGFYFTDEDTKTTPETEQQETGTIRFLEYYIKNHEYPTNSEINKLANFNFDSDYYNSFVFQADAILEHINLNSNYSIDLDSDSSKIGHKIFSILKSKGFSEKKDNWNPADIWIYIGKDKKNILKQLEDSLNTTEFNLRIKEMFESNILIGTSLKKVLRKTSPKIIDISKLKPVDLKFMKWNMSIKNTYVDIRTTGYPEKFMIRARAKAKSISKASDIKIYFEGKVYNSSVFLGAISKNIFNKLIKNGDKAPANLTKDDLKTLIKEVESTGFMSVLDQDFVDSMTLIQLQYQFVLLRYVKTIFSQNEEFINSLGRSGLKMNDYSSIHLKIGG